MKILILLQIIALTAFASSNNECISTKIIVDENLYDVCIDSRKVYSLNCKKMESCFPTPLKPYEHKSTQNPLFSLCLANKGIPHFAKLKDSNKKVTICMNEKNQIIDLNSLMRSFKNAFLENKTR